MAIKILKKFLYDFPCFNIYVLYIIFYDVEIIQKSRHRFSVPRDRMFVVRNEVSSARHSSGYLMWDCNFVSL